MYPLDGSILSIDNALGVLVPQSKAAPVISQEKLFSFNLSHAQSKSNSDLSVVEAPSKALSLFTGVLLFLL